MTAKQSAERLEGAEVALAATRVAQAEFWRALGDLESCLETELNSTVDFRDASIEALLNPKESHLY